MMNVTKAMMNAIGTATATRDFQLPARAEVIELLRPLGVGESLPSNH
jgi:hypothetical protein